MSCCGSCGGEDVNKVKEENKAEDETLKQEKDNEAEQAKSEE